MILHESEPKCGKNYFYDFIYFLHRLECGKIDFDIFFGKHIQPIMMFGNRALKVIDLKLLRAWNSSRMIDPTDSFPDLCCTSPDFRFLGGRHPKY